MFCIKCGTKLEDGAKFCIKCGARVEEEPATEALPSTQELEPKANPEPQYAQTAQPVSPSKKSKKAPKNKVDKNKPTGPVKRKTSVLGVFAIILSVLPILHLIGGLLGFIDLLVALIGKKWKINQAVVALCFSLCWTAGLTALLYPKLAPMVKAMNLANNAPQLTGDALEATDDDNVFVVNSKMKVIKGKAQFSGKTPIKIHYKWTAINDYLVAEGDIDYKKQWKLDEGGLAVGANQLEIDYMFEDSSLDESYSYIIINNEDINAEGMEMYKTDTDGDGLSDGYELSYTGTDYDVADSDGNGVSDGDEDTDLDGTSNADEMEAGTTPNSSDSDGDGIADGEEAALNCDPTNEDTDGDGLTDAYEIEIGLDPTVPLKKDPANEDAPKGEICANVSEEFSDGETVDVKITGDPEVIPSLGVLEIPETNAMYQDIEGITGTAMDFELDGDFSSVEVSITIPEDEFEENTEYRLYYFNEETCEAELVENQSLDGNVVTAELEHFSIYFINKYKELDPTQIHTVSEDGNTYLANDDEPYEAFYDSYEDYLAAMYPGKDVLSMHMLTNNITSANAFDTMGHTWTSYYHGSSDADMSWGVIDADCDNLTYGSIGYGGWIMNPSGNMDGSSGLEGRMFALTHKWPGSFKYPDHVEFCYGADTFEYEAFINTYTQFSGYKDLDDMVADRATSEGRIYLGYDELNANGATEDQMATSVAVPFVLSNSDQLEGYADYANQYVGNYIALTNNCTTVADGMIKAAGVGSRVNIRSNVSAGLSNVVAYVGGSPGQAAASAQSVYAYTCVYAVTLDKGDGEKTYFTSNWALDTAGKRAQEAREEAEEAEEAGEDANETLGDSEGGYLVLWSPLASALTENGQCPLWILHGVKIPNPFKEAEVNNYLDEYVENGAIDFQYAQFPSIMAQEIEKCLPEQYVFSSTEEYNAYRQSLTGSSDPHVMGEGLAWDICLNLAYVENGSPEEFYREVDWSYMSTWDGLLNWIARILNIA